ncbi:DNA-directed RNA polymerase subunit omega [Bosea sp. RCC_152_1]|uniref:DNA-directed RNA polymerase subunit omega n=1 Tax=Bosea sp. RCC_152_1 TaxID=3239228 RepID=UPI0035240C88
MDPLVVFDCEKVLPNRFAVALTAAARSRALRRGALPRSQAMAVGADELALREIAEGAFTPVELAQFLGGPGRADLLPAPTRQQEHCPGAPDEGVEAPVPSSRGRFIDDATNQQGG